VVSPFVACVISPDYCHGVPCQVAAVTAGPPVIASVLVLHFLAVAFIIVMVLVRWYHFPSH